MTAKQTGVTVPAHDYKVARRCARIAITCCIGMFLIVCGMFSINYQQLLNESSLNRENMNLRTLYQAEQAKRRAVEHTLEEHGL